MLTLTLTWLHVFIVHIVVAVWLHGWACREISLDCGRDMFGQVMLLTVLVLIWPAVLVVFAIHSFLKLFR